MQPVLFALLIGCALVLVLLDLENFAFPVGEDAEPSPPSENKFGRYLRRLALLLRTSSARMFAATARSSSHAVNWLARLHRAAAIRAYEPVHTRLRRQAWGHARAALRATEAGHWSVGTSELMRAYRYARLLSPKEVGSSPTEHAALGHSLAHTALMLRHQLDEVEAVAHQLVAQTTERAHDAETEEVVQHAYD